MIPLLRVWGIQGEEMGCLAIVLAGGPDEVFGTTRGYTGVEIVSTEPEQAQWQGPLL